MAINTSSGPQINMTPMIDILLVLIIIFMVLRLHHPEGLDAQVPQPSSSEQRPPAVQQDIVLTVEGGGNVLVNQDPILIDTLEERLKAMFKATARPIVFIRGKKDLAFQEIAQVIDLAKGAGFQKVALMNY